MTMSMFERPDWIVSPVRTEHLDYVWDDTRASADFQYDADWLPGAMEDASVRARMAMCVGLYEQIAWRMQAAVDTPSARELAAAAWSATVDPRYLPFFDLDRSVWIGPIYGPLWCAATWLQPALRSGDFHDDEIDDALVYLARLANHVSPRPDVLVAWMMDAAKFLSTHHPHEPRDPFSDIFNRFPGMHRGRLVARSDLGCLSPASKVQAQGQLLALLSNSLSAGNEFLPEVDELEAMGLNPGSPRCASIFLP